MTAPDIAVLAESFLRWFADHPCPCWRQALDSWPPARGLSPAELRRLRVAIIVARNFHGADQAEEGGR